MEIYSKQGTNMQYKFETWLRECAREAMRSEWCIDPDWPRWFEMYLAGKSYTEAVDELFKEVRAVNAPNEKGQR